MSVLCRNFFPPEWNCSQNGDYKIVGNLNFFFLNPGSFSFEDLIRERWNCPLNLSSGCRMCMSMLLKLYFHAAGWKWELKNSMIQALLSFCNTGLHNEKQLQSSPFIPHTKNTSKPKPKQQCIPVVQLLPFVIKTKRQQCRKNHNSYRTPLIQSISYHTWLYWSSKLRSRNITSFVCIYIFKSFFVY